LVKREKRTQFKTEKLGMESQVYPQNLNKSSFNYRSKEKTPKKLIFFMLIFAGDMLINAFHYNFKMFISFSLFFFCRIE
jgi:hypothetical protein